VVPHSLLRHNPAAVSHTGECVTPSVSTDYVHGYSAGENVRLTDEATTLTGLPHAGTALA